MPIGKISLCATPIGNLEDISFRVLRTLKEADLIAAEDTRNSIKLLNHFEIKTPMTAYHEFNKVEKARELIAQCLEGKHIALITAVEQGIPVESLPGAAAFVLTLSLSALSTRRFCFEAFLPTEKANKKERQRLLSQLKDEERTILLYEAPHHLRKTLEDLREAFGENRKITLARELTKKYEELLYLDLDRAIERYQEEEPRGEFALAIEGKSLEKKKEEAKAQWEELSMEEHLQEYLDKGLSEKEAMKMVAKDRGIGKREVYQYLKAGD